MTHAVEAEITLPNGIWREGEYLRKARVRPIGEEDADLQEELDCLRLPVERVSALLAHCVTHLGSWKCEGTAHVSRLPMGDREALLSHIRRLSFGDSIPCTLRCPSCSALMDFELRAFDLLVQGEEQKSPYHEELFSTNSAAWRARFRVPCAADLETALAAHRNTPSDAARAVLDQCVDWVRRQDLESTDDVPAAAWPLELLSQIDARISSIDPQAEITLQLQCPNCRHEFSALFDTADYLLREIAAREKQLYYDVHRLALAYHWSESAILGMTPRKRKRYLDLLEGEAWLD